MEKLFVLLAAIALVILGARGTYKSVWNQFFPNEQIVTTPTSTTGSSGSSGSAYNPKGGQPGQTPTTPVQVGQQGANATKAFAKSVIKNLAGNSGSNVHTVPAAGGGPYPVESVGRTQQTVVNTGVPSWWPSFLPYPSWFPHPGEGQTGISIPNPFAP